jgi:methionyl aminopeptidase
VSIKSNAEFEKLRIIGGIVARALRTMAAQIRPDITTGELNAIGARVLAENGARSAPPSVYGFPGDICISVNEEAMHGIPGGAYHPAWRSGETRSGRGKGRLLR